MSGPIPLNIKNAAATNVVTALKLRRVGPKGFEPWKNNGYNCMSRILKQTEMEQARVYEMALLSILKAPNHIHISCIYGIGALVKPYLLMSNMKKEALTLTSESNSRENMAN